MNKTTTTTTSIIPHKGNDVAVLLYILPFGILVICAVLLVGQIRRLKHRLKHLRTTQNQENAHNRRESYDMQNEPVSITFSDSPDDSIGITSNDVMSQKDASLTIKRPNKVHAGIRNRDASTVTSTVGRQFDHLYRENIAMNLPQYRNKIPQLANITINETLSPDRPNGTETETRTLSVKNKL